MAEEVNHLHALIVQAELAIVNGDMVLDLFTMMEAHH